MKIETYVIYVPYMVVTARALNTWTVYGWIGVEENWKNRGKKAQNLHPGYGQMEEEDNIYGWCLYMKKKIDTD